MNLGLIGNVIKKVGELAVQNSPTILTACAVGGTVWTGVTAADAAIKARDIIKAHEMDEELKCERIQQVDGVVTDHLVYYRERTFSEKAMLTWKIWARPIFIGGTTIACIVSSNRISTSRNLALAAAYSMSEESAREFRNKVAETVGEKKLKKIDNEIVQDHIENAGSSEVVDIVHTVYGEQLMFDDWSKRYFRSRQNEVEKRVNMLNKRMTNKLCNATVNDFYELIGLPPIDAGEYWGWIYDHMNDEPDVTVSFHPAMSPQGEACIGVRIKPELMGVKRRNDY